MVKVLGIDPGLRRTGWGVIEITKKGQLCFAGMGVVNTSTCDTLPKRLTQIFHGIQKIITEHSPLHVAIEETYVNTNYQTSLQLAHARAAAIVAASQLELTPICYKATVVKKAITNSGNANKEQIFKMLKLWLKDFDDNNKHFDASDALAICVCHARSIGL
ncbi:crossover junction endodeoxyribonuclease RuvC [Candidatus Lariskella endosymbiont of Hedychridium roseum]|uniref:crossover junction endodeoxyribonuclease RuvC n=1 Tax=Candidatus Lariskella endosymbiont of Hedychridium roseum TaxID=3077949 RepID=UPI0030D09113